MLDLSTLICPTKVIGADPTLPYAYLPTFDLSHASAVDYDFVPQASHFLQLEQPAQCAAMVREYVTNLDVPTVAHGDPKGEVRAHRPAYRSRTTSQWLGRWNG